MKDVLLYIFTGVLIFTGSGSCRGAEIEVNASIDKLNYVIGDWIPVSIEAVHSPDIIVFPPDMGEKAGELDIIRLFSYDPVREKDLVRDRWRLVLAAYDTGTFAIPAIELQYHETGDTVVRAIQTDPIDILVYSAGGDTIAAPHDIKPPVSTPLAFADFLPYVVGILISAILVIAYLWWKKWRKRPQKTEESHVIEIEIDPFERALKRFVDLNNRKLWESGFVKEYWSEVTEIVREFIEGAFGIPALEMTTDELFRACKGLEILSEMEYLKLFTDADLVKFAKFIPDAENCKEALLIAEKIVKQANLRRKVQSSISNAN